MAYQTLTFGVAGSGISDRISGWIAAARENLHCRKVYHETLRELSALSTRDLRDLGLNQSELKRIAHEAAYTR